jgi:AcrR family transcriptional regulator
MRILASAKQNFLANGYKSSNLRKICKDAGITTGALYRHFPDKASLFASIVDSVVQGIKNIYAASTEECFSFFNENEITQAFQVSYKAVTGFMNYIYENLDYFKLLLMCSNGTKYVHFVDDMVTLEMNEREKIFKILKKKNIEFSIVRRRESHLLTHSYFASIFEVVAHDFTRKEALDYAHTLVTYSNAGWRAILGI